MKSLNDIVDDSFDRGERVISLPPGQFFIERTIEASGPFVLHGAGRWLTSIIPVYGIDCFRLTSPNMRARRFASESPQFRHKLGVELHDFQICGTRGYGQRGVVLSGGCDEVLIEDVGFENLRTGMAIEADSRGVGFVRESWFSRIVFRNCGTISDPALSIVQSDSATEQDGINHLRFTDCAVIYAPGIGIHVQNRSKTEVIRFIQFDGLMSHGMPDGESKSKALMQIEGRVVAVTLNRWSISAFSEFAFVHRVNESGGLKGFSASGFATRQCENLQGGDAIEELKMNVVRF